MTVINGQPTNHSGYVEEMEGLEEFNFAEQYHTFQSKGYAVDPGSTGIVGDAQKHAEAGGKSIPSSPFLNCVSTRCE